MGGNLLLNRLGNPYRSRYARGGIRGMVTAIFHVCSVCSYWMSHQHLDAKIVKNFP